MTREEAIEWAIGKAIRTGKFIYVVYEDGEFDTATDNDMNSYWFGAKVILNVSPEGEVNGE